MARIYGTGSNSSIGASQTRDFFWQRKALIELQKEQYFMQLSDTTNLPKHMGKKIKRYHYLPMLDDANINDQGIDASGNTDNYVATLILQPPGVNPSQNGEGLIFLVGEGNSSANALTAAKAQTLLESEVANAGHTVVTWDTNYATTIADYIAAGWKVTDDRTVDANFVAGFDYKVPVFDGGNLYGSSKDVGTISAKLPALSETGGRVNRVGFRRVELEATIEKLGIFDEYTEDSVNFDSDADLMMHVNREMIRGATEISEDALQLDLLNAPGIVRFGGDAVSTATVTGDSGSESVPTYEDLMRLSIDLDNNRCPKDTTILTGTRNTDTKTVNAARYLYIGSEMIPTVKKMKSIDASSAAGSGFVSVEKYAAGGTIARGEIGQIDQFKIIVVPEMQHWEGAGAALSGTTNAGYRHDGTNYNVYPMLVVGSKSFTTIGFQTAGKAVKFKIKHSKPGDNISYSTDDPYGEKGFMSIKWWYGTMILRPEHIALVKAVAEY